MEKPERTPDDLRQMALTAAGTAGGRGQAAIVWAVLYAGDQLKRIADVLEWHVYPPKQETTFPGGEPRVPGVTGDPG